MIPPTSHLSQCSESVWSGQASVLSHSPGLVFWDDRVGGPKKKKKKKLSCFSSNLTTVLGWSDGQVWRDAWKMKQEGDAADSRVTKHQRRWQDQRPQSAAVTSLQLIGRYRPSQLLDQKMEKGVNNLTVAICRGWSDIKVSFLLPTPALCVAQSPFREQRFFSFSFFFLPHLRSNKW